jgi:MFS family permease
MYIEHTNISEGRMGDMFGHKRMFLLGWIWFTLFSFMAGFAHSWGPIAFSVTRGFQGIGPALLVPNAMALIGRTYPVGDKRAIALSLFGACGPTGFLTGSAFSSLLAQLTSRCILELVSRSSLTFH